MHILFIIYTHIDKNKHNVKIGKFSELIKKYMFRLKWKRRQNWRRRLLFWKKIKIPFLIIHRHHAETLFKIVINIYFNVFLYPYVIYLNAK